MKHWLLLSLLFFPVFSQAQIITTFAGGGTILGDGGPATAAQFPSGIGGAIFDQNGNCYVAGSDRIRMVAPTNIISTVAGTGILGFGGDNGPATNALINSAIDVAIDSAGNLYIADAGNNRIRKVDKATGIITTVAGNGTSGFSGDGTPATSANLNSPEFICIDKFNNLYISDFNNVRIRKVNSFGIISTVAGNGTKGFGGDGGLADTTMLRSPFGITTDSVGNLYIADGFNYRVRKINIATGIISTIAGNGISGYSAEGLPATVEKFGEPSYLKFDAVGNLYISDVGDYRVFRMDARDTIYTVAGNGTRGISGDGGLATSAELFTPEGIAVDGCGDIYISDENRVRKVTYPPVFAIPSITLSGNNTVAAGATVTVTATVANTGPSYMINWMNHGKLFATTTVPFTTYTKGAGVDTITATVASTADYGCYDTTTSAGHMVSVDKTGITPLSPEGGLIIYPNPAHNDLTIIANDKINQITISNLFGQTLYTREYNTAKVQLDVSAFPPGVYFIKINGTEVSKFLKQ